MAYRELAEKYAKQLKEATTELKRTNDRVIELEGTIADRDSQAVELKLIITSQSNEAASNAPPQPPKLEGARSRLEILERTINEKHETERHLTAAEDQVAQLIK